MLLLKDEIFRIEIHKEINPYSKGDSEMLHVISKNPALRDEGNNPLAGFCLDKEGFVVRQGYVESKNECVYKAYENATHKTILEKNATT